MDIQDLYAKLSIFYWSKSHPSTFTIKHPVSGAPVGLGVIAFKNYAAFNLAWAIHSGKLSNLEQHWEAAGTFGAVRHLLESEEAEEVSDMITLLSPEEFSKWYMREIETVPTVLQPWIEDALTKLGTIHKI